jgi:O-antigen/teichoic acid export membrane protein
LDQKKQHTSIVGSSIRIFVIRFFSTLASLVITIFFAHHLEPARYGSFQNFWTQLTVASAVGCLGMALLIFNFPPDTLRHLIKRLKPLYYRGYFLLLIAIGIAFTLLRYHEGADILQKGYLSFFFFLLYTVCILLEAFLTVLKKFRLLTISSIIYALSFIGSAAYSYHSGFRLETFIVCLLPFLLLRFVLLFIPFYKFMKQQPEGKIIKPGLRNVQSLWMHLGFYDIVTMLIIWADKFAISIVAKDETSAVYFNGSINIPFLPIILSAVSSATLMQLTISATPEEKTKLMQQAGKLLSCAAYPLFFFLLAFRTEFIHTVFSERYDASIPIFVCSLLILPVRAYSNTIILQNLQKGKIMNLGVILDFIVAIALIYPLYLWLGLGGIALSFVISTYVQSLFYLYHSAKLLRVSMLSLVPLKNWLIKAAFFGVLSFTLHFSLQQLKPLISLSIAAAICGIAAAIILKIEMKRTNTIHT